MKRYSVLFALALALFAAPAYASVWTDALSYDGIVDDIQDNSVSFALVENGDKKVSAGDVIIGILKWNLNTSDSVTVADHAVSVFAAMVTADNGFSANVVGGNKMINFSLGVAPGVLDALLPTISAAIGGFSADALGITLSHVGGADPTLTSAGSAFSLIDTTYDPDFEFGLAGSDYFEAELRDHRKDFAVWTGGAAGLAGLAGDGVISLKDTDGDGWIDEFDDRGGASPVGPGSIIPAGAQTGSESGGFSVLRDFNSPLTIYVPVETVTLAGTAGPLADIALQPSTSLLQPNATQIGNDFQFADQAFISLNAVPEPASMAVWGGLMLVGGVAGYRRRKAAKVA